MKKFISLLFTFFLAFTLACDDSDSNDSGDDVTDPVETRGSLDVILTWPSGSVTSPSVTAYLTPDEGTAESIDFTVGKNSASCTESGLDAGSYTLALELLDGTQTAWDGTRDISITGGETTEVAIALDEDDIETPQGSLSVTITWPEKEVMSPSVEA
ncbi:MAG TPA: hypothetical protein PK859_13995, partial [Spirochaetota bacterium]|nr:hypothetical protein [Spirochaetota bacterium]